MNEAKFTELVNLYFDREISSVEIGLLREELAASPVRKNEFEARYRLHQAMRMAVAPEALEVAQFRELTAKKTTRASRLTIWVLSSGIAACVSVGFVLLRPVLEESSSVASAEELTELARSGMERFAATQEPGESRRGSLASQLRLMGLTPEIAPVECQLSSVDVEALRQREARRQHEIDRMNQYEAYSAMPEPRLFESLEHPTRESQSQQQQRWPAGFQRSLASF